MLPVSVRLSAAQTHSASHDFRQISIRDSLRPYQGGFRRTHDTVDTTNVNCHGQKHKDLHDVDVTMTLATGSSTSQNYGISLLP